MKATSRPNGAASAPRGADGLCGPDGPGGGAARKIMMVTLRLTLIGPSLFVIVLDEDPRVPVLQEAADLDESGRGLALVAALARTWGHYPVGTAGKAVWAEIDVSGPPGGTANQSLPQREPWEQAQARGVRPMEDVRTLRRVLDGLRHLDDQ